MHTLEEVSKIVWEKCIAARPDEKALIVSDPVGERLEIAEALTSTCPCRCRLIEMKPTCMPGREPAPKVAAEMLKADIVIAPTEFSITHTKATAAARKNGARVATMPGITKAIFIRAIPTDYDKTDEVNTRLKGILLKTGKLRLTTSIGTELAMETMKGRKVCNDNGLSKKPGALNNLPAGEVALAPKEGSASGAIVFDLSSLGARLKKPFRVEVKDGHAVSCEHEELWNILKGVENGTNLAELGIGTNPKAIITGTILEDEKVKGTAHIAFGTSTALGGTIQTSIHLDSVFDKPTIEVDGKVIIKEGKFLF